MDCWRLCSSWEIASPRVGYTPGANWHSFHSFLSPQPPPEGGPPNTLSLTYSKFQVLTQTLTTSQSAQNASSAIFASNQLQNKVQSCFLETVWFSAHGAHLPELDVPWVMQILLTNELHSTLPWEASPDFPSTIISLSRSLGICLSRKLSCDFRILENIFQPQVPRVRFFQFSLFLLLCKWRQQCG